MNFLNKIINLLNYNTHVAVEDEKEVNSATKTRIIKCAPLQHLLASSSNNPLEDDGLSKYGLSSQDLLDIRLHIFRNYDSINEMANGELLHVRKNDSNQLPRSFVFIPEKEGRPAEAYILLKTHNIDPLGKGSKKNVTKTLGFIIQDKQPGNVIGEKAFLSGAAEDLQQDILNMEKLKGQPHCLISDYFVKYIGNVKGHTEKNIPKIGMIMDLTESDFYEFCKKQPLLKSGQLSPTAVKILSGAASGLKEMHQLGLVHSDVLPDNIAVLKGSVGKIADFGMAQRDGSRGHLSTFFNPPEVHVGEAGYSPSVDVFQLGITLMIVSGYEKYAYLYKKAAEKYFNSFGGDINLYKEAHDIFELFKKDHSSRSSSRAQYNPIVDLIYDCVRPQNDRISLDSFKVRLEAQWLYAELNSSKMSVESPQVDLKNGTKVPQHLVYPIMNALKTLERNTYSALDCLFSKCDGSYKDTKENAVNIPFLVQKGLLLENGSVSNIVKNILLSSSQRDTALFNKIMIGTPLLSGKEVLHPKEESIRDNFKNIEENFAELRKLIREAQSLFGDVKDPLPKWQHIQKAAFERIIKEGAPASKPNKAETHKTDSEKPTESVYTKEDNPSVESSEPIKTVNPIYTPALPRKPKPPAVEWNKFNWQMRITPQGDFAVSANVPINIGSYPINANVEIQIDPKVFPIIWQAIFKKHVKIGEQDFKQGTDLGQYKINFYKMGSALWPGTDKYKVKIRDPQGHKHTRWVYGKKKLTTDINQHIKELHGRALQSEIASFSQTFKDLLGHGDVQGAKQKLDVLLAKCGNSIAETMKNTFQLAIDEVSAVEKVKKLANTSIKELKQHILDSTKQNVVGKAQHTEQMLMRELYRQKLLQSGSLEDLAEAREIASTSMGIFKEPPELKKPQLPPSERFKGHNSHSRNEMRNRAQVYVDKMFEAYAALIDAVNRGKGVEAARNRLVATFHAINGMKHVEGFKVPIKDYGDLGHWLIQAANDIYNCATGQSAWLNEYLSLKNKTHPLFSEDKISEIEIGINKRLLQETRLVLNNPETKLEDRKTAFTQENKITEHLVKLLEIQNPQDPELPALKAKADFYLECNGSYECAEASKAIQELEKPYVEDKENDKGKKIVRIDRMPEEVLDKIYGHTKFIGDNARKTSGLQTYSQNYHSLVRGKLISNYTLTFLKTSLTIQEDKDEKTTQAAFQEQNEVAKKLDKLDLKEDELRELKFEVIKSTIKHFEFCEGSYVFSKKLQRINSIMKRHEDKNGNCQTHQITEEERVEISKLAASLYMNSKKDGKLFTFSISLMSTNYKILSDSYGKYGALFATHIFTHYIENIKNKNIKLLAKIAMQSSIVPAVLQELCILPLAMAQGHSRAGWNNVKESIVSGIVHTLDWKKHRLDALNSVANLGLVLATHFLDKNEKGRKTLEYAHVAMRVSSAISYVEKGGSPWMCLSSVPFTVYEFVARRDFLFLGHLPENIYYHTLRGVWGHFFNAESSLQLSRRLKGPHADNRDRLGASAFVVAATIFDLVTGKFDYEAMLAMKSNVEIYDRRGDYHNALISLNALKSKLDTRYANVKDEKIESLKAYVLQVYVDLMMKRGRQAQVQQRI